VTNLPGFLILRYLAGFFASPALATGGASLGDVIPAPHMPVGLGIWGVGAICGPFLGPLIGAALVEAKSWRWTFWYLAIQGAAALIVLTFFLPETSQATLLHRKAKRLRALTGNDKIVAKEAYEAAQKPFKDIVVETLWRPIEVSFLEPMILSVNIHLALLYAIIYLWFESFPIVFQGIHNFTIVELGVSYIPMMLGAWLGLGLYLPYIRRRFTIPILKGDPVEPEVFLPPNLAGAICLPVGLFIFAWTSTASVHWIVPIIGSFLFAPGMFLLFQTHLNYLGFAFPRHMASVFAGNDLFRSCVGAAFPLFANALYRNTGSQKFPVGWGCSIMAFICTAMIAIPIVFLWKGKTLRLMSKRSQ
jgi:DHA1 family multidrug resistance protein-like MFS transporter